MYTADSLSRAILFELGFTEPPDPYTEEREKCRRDPAYFIERYCRIFDPVSKEWIEFHLWAAQIEALEAIHSNQLTIVLKARQLGLSWLSLGYGLWQMLFQPIATVLIFSLRENEAVYLASDERLRGMYARLPEWMKSPVQTDGATLWGLANGSTARAFPTGRGDSYAATYAIIDEADLIPDLDKMLTSIKPTITAGGKLVIISRADKRAGESAFKKIYRDARLGKNNYKPIFIPWFAHPQRDQAWYEAQVKDAVTIDEVYEQYPATEEEALAPGYAGLVYPKFSLTENVTDAADYDPAYPIFFSVDDGYTDQRVIGLWQVRFAQGKPDRVCLFNEVVHTEKLAFESLKEALQRAQVRFDKELNEVSVQDAQLAVAMSGKHIEFVYYDPSAASFSAECQNLGLSTWDAYNKIAEGIKVVRRFILDGNGERRLLIHPRCEVTIKAMSNYRTKEQASDGADPKPVHDIFSHPADMVRYFIATRYLYDE